MTKTRKTQDDEPDALVLFHGQRFAQVPESVFRDRRLSPSARLLLAYLFIYRNKDSRAWPSQSRLADELGVAPRRLRRWLLELRHRRWIVIAARISVQPDWAGNPMARVYHIYDRALPPHSLGQKRPSGTVKNDLTVRSKMTTDYTTRLSHTNPPKEAAASQVETIRAKFGQEQFQAAIRYAEHQGADYPEQYAMAALVAGAKFHSDGTKVRGRKTAQTVEYPTCPKCGQLEAMCYCDEVDDD